MRRSLLLVVWLVASAVAAERPLSPSTRDFTDDSTHSGLNAERATVTAGSGVSAQRSSRAEALSYPIVDTGQATCYDNRSGIAPPGPGQPLYGQDAQFRGHQPSYTRSADGLTVSDRVTGLTWQRSPDTNGDGALTGSDKLTLSQAQARPAGRPPLTPDASIG
jgi:hypothetical protein